MGERPVPSRDPQPISADRPTRMGPWWLRNTWRNLTFVHWAYPPKDVQAILPPGLVADTFEGRAYVSLVPFQMFAAAPRFAPTVPRLSNFAETNVRTYVVDSRGRRCVWFCSLEATSLPITMFARWGLGFPYIWSDLEVYSEPGRSLYRTRRRRWPRTPAASTEVDVEIGERIDEPDDLDDFLTARWGTITRWPSTSGPLIHHPVDHPAWALRHARLASYADTSIQAAGLPEPTGAPRVRWADRVEARFGLPSLVGKGRLAP